jgi:hypothetical protein
MKSMQQKSKLCTTAQARKYSRGQIAMLRIANPGGGCGAVMYVRKKKACCSIQQAFFFNDLPINWKA